MDMEFLYKMAEFASVFKLEDPKIQDAWDELKRDVVRHEELLGQYKDKRVFDKAVSDMEKGMRALNSDIAQAKQMSDGIKSERNEIRAEIKSRTDAGVAEIKSDYADKTKELEVQLGKLAEDTLELNRQLGPAKKAHNDREVDLNGREHNIKTGEDNIQVERRWIATEKERLRVISAKLGALEI